MSQAANGINTQRAKKSPSSPIDYTAEFAVANGAKCTSYDFKRYVLALRKDGRPVGEILIGRDEAVKLALTILTLRVAPDPLTGDAMKQLTADLFGKRADAVETATAV